MIYLYVPSYLEISSRVGKNFCSFLIGLVLGIFFVALKVGRVKCVAVFATTKNDDGKHYERDSDEYNNHDKYNNGNKYNDDNECKYGGLKPHVFFFTLIV